MGTNPKTIVVSLNSYLNRLYPKPLLRSQCRAMWPLFSSMKCHHETAVGLGVQVKPWGSLWVMGVGKWASGSAYQELGDGWCSLVLCSVVSVVLASVTIYLGYKSR